MESTTDLATVRRTPSAFTWGTIRQIHDIGPYCLVEYTDRHNDRTPTTVFHVYVDGESTNNGFPTMDEALLYAIARKHLEINDARHMANGACRLFGIQQA
jgi:hypothetical protein